MRQARGADHQGQGEQRHVEPGVVQAGVVVEAQVHQDLVEACQKRHARVHVGGEQAQLRDRIAGELQRDEHRRDRVGDDQHDVLRHLGIGDALHAAQHRVHEHHRRGDQQAGVGVDLQEARERHAGAGHLPDHVGDRDHQQRRHRHQPRGAAVVAVADELGHGEAAELAQVGRQQHRQQHVAAGPAHEIRRVAVADEGDQARHRDERRRRHPVCGDRHAVHHRVDAASGGVELGGGSGARPDRDRDVEQERAADENEVESELVHGRPLIDRARARRTRDRAGSCTRCRRRSAR